MADAMEIEHKPLEHRTFGGEYQIQKFQENFIGHGQIIQSIGDNKIEVEASFLRFQNLDEAKTIHLNLSHFNSESFLRSYFIIQEQSYYWVAVEKIDCSFHYYKDSHEPFSKIGLNPNYQDIRLNPNYQDIIRDIIRGMCQIHQSGLTHGNPLNGTPLTSERIVIIKDRAKLAFITNNSPTPRTDFKNLRTIFRNILGHIPKYVELRHFLHTARIKNLQELQKLYFHPLLMSSGERFLLPVRADTRLRYRTGRFVDYAREYMNLFPRDIRWIDIVQNRDDQDYSMLVARSGVDGYGTRYQNDAWAQFKFVRNTTLYINDHIRQQNNLEKMEAEFDNSLQLAKVKTEGEVEKDLSSMFPDFLTNVYDFLSLKEIKPSLRMHFDESEERAGEKSSSV